MCFQSACFKLPSCSLSNVLQILGLEICADTLVGDPIRRGISGGQKKRLTTGSVGITVNFACISVSRVKSDIMLHNFCIMQGK